MRIAPGNLLCLPSPTLTTTQQRNHFCASPAIPPPNWVIFWGSSALLLPQRSWAFLPFTASLASRRATLSLPIANPRLLRFVQYTVCNSWSAHDITSSCTSISIYLLALCNHHTKETAFEGLSNVHTPNSYTLLTCCAVLPCRGVLEARLALLPLRADVIYCPPSRSCTNSKKANSGVVRPRSYTKWLASWLANSARAYDRGRRSMILSKPTNSARETGIARSRI